MNNRRSIIGGSRFPSPRLVMLGMLILITPSCAPSQRLYFPKTPIRQAEHIIWYDVDHNGKSDFALIQNDGGKIESIGYDDDEDGNLDRVYRLDDYSAGKVPHLILLLDSIPFLEVADRYQAGDFRWFDPPQKVIAPFPSLTEASYTELFHAPPLPGIIDQYYNQRSGHHDDLWERVKGSEQPWERRLDYHNRFYEQGLSYLDPRPWHAAEMKRVHQALDASATRVTFAYVMSASSMMCKYGKQGAAEILDDVRQLCLQLLYERKGAIKISILADHGHNLTPSRNFHIDEVLRGAGFNPCDRIEEDRDIVLEMNGLVTYAGIHTRQPAKVCDALVNHSQVEVGMYLQGSAVIVRNARGSALIDCKSSMLRYQPIDADVLEYQPVLDHLRAMGKLSSDGYAADDDWFAATQDHYWPDAPRRIWDAFHGRAANSPSLMLSIRDGYYVGLSSFEKFITMVSTHGGLNQVNSATFVMSMTGRMHGALRTADVLPMLEPGYVPPLKR